MTRSLLVALLATLWIGSPALAATISTIGTFSAVNDFNDYYFSNEPDEDPPSSNLQIQDSPVVGLQQFDPSLGTLTGITLSADFTMDVDATVEVFEVGGSGSNVSHSAGFTMVNGPGPFAEQGVGTLVRYNASTDASNFTRSMLYQGLDIAGSCAGVADEGNQGCLDTVSDTLTFTQSGNAFDNFNVFQNFELIDILGTGNLDGLVKVATLLYDGQLWKPGVDTINVIEAEGLTEAYLNAGTVTIEYEYTAVPVPAAAWLFGSALGVFGFLRRRRAGR